MTILILEVFRTCHNGSFLPGKETPVTVAKRYSNKGSMPTTRIQPLVRRPLENLSTTKESPADNWKRLLDLLVLGEPALPPANVQRWLRSSYSSYMTDKTVLNWIGSIQLSAASTSRIDGKQFHRLFSRRDTEHYIAGRMFGHVFSRRAKYYLA